MVATGERRFHRGPTGLGTSAARILSARGADDAPAREPAWPPRFFIPFPTQMSADVERARRQGLRWARAMGIVENDQQAAALDAPRYDRLAAGAYPLACGEDLDLPVQWMMWFFSFDDVFDGPFGTDPVASGALIETTVALMYGDCDPTLADPPLVRGFLDLCRRSVTGSPPSWLTRFHSDTETYLRSYPWEVANRALHRTPSSDVYLEMRRHSIGVWMSLDLVEKAGHFAMPHTAFRSEAIQAMRRLCADVIVMVNDVLSAGKDAHYRDLNLVTLLRDEEGIETGEAVVRIQELVAARVRHYQQLEAGLDRVHHDLNLPPASYADLRRYAYGMRSWMRSNLDWSLETVRYREHPPPS